jgi:lysophospholipase L1-like esterase
LIALMIGAVELLSLAAWKLIVPADVRRNINALCRSSEAQPEKLPNTFWHHALNPNHPAYKGIVNSKGTKGEEFSVPKPPGEFRVICVGDSTVEGTGVAPHESFPYRLQEMLQPLIGPSSRYRTVRVINAGIGSHNTAFNLAYLQFRLIHYQPDVVVIKSAYNDYVPYVVPGMQYDYTNAFPTPFCFANGATPYWKMARYSYFMSVIGSLIFPTEVGNPFSAFSGTMTPEQFRAMDFSSNESKFFIYAENIRSMILTCKGRGIRVIVLDLPTSPDLKHFGGDTGFGERFRSVIARLETELRRVTAEEGVPFIETGPLESDDFWDHCHNTAAGNRKIAQRIAATLTAEVHANAQ